jgi:hypothetical protein
MNRFLMRSIFLLAAMVALQPWSARADDTIETGGSAPSTPKKAAAVEDDTPPADAASVAEAKKVLQTYLDAVKDNSKGKKWDTARKLTHPRTLEVIAEIKARTGTENHPLAPWAHMTESYLTDFKLGDAAPTAKGAVVVSSTEEAFDVPDQGTEADIKAEYLLLPLGGKWYVADRRLGEGQFPKETLADSYKGYFDGQYVAKTPAKAEAAVKAKKSKKSKKKG